MSYTFTMDDDRRLRFRTGNGMTVLSDVPVPEDATDVSVSDSPVTFKAMIDGKWIQLGPSIYNL